MEGKKDLFAREVRSALETLPQQITIMHAHEGELSCVLMTESMTRIFGDDAEKARGNFLKSYMDLVDPEDLQTVRDKVQEAMRHPGRTYAFRVRVRTRPDARYFSENGHICAKDARKYIPDAKDGELLVFLTLSECIEEVEALPEKERIHQLIMDEVLNTTRDCIYWKDRERRFVGVNQAFLDFFGLDSDTELIGKTDEDMDWHPDSEPFVEDEEQVLQGASTILSHGKYVIRGQERDILANKSPVYDHGEIIGFVGSFIDVTRDYERMREIERLDHELKAALDKEKQSNRNLSDFMKKLSHELRTPMNAVIGLSGLGMKTDSLMASVEYMRKINSSGQYVLGIINDVLDLNKLESGRLKLNPGLIRLGELFDVVDTIIAPLAKEKGIRYSASYQCDTDAWILCDRQRIQQILLNLLNNAVKFTEEKGDVRLKVLGREMPDEIRLDFYIRDNGIGMSEAFQEHMFHPFTQENKDPFRYDAGTGLGLTITKALVTEMNGAIEVESHENQGSEFHVMMNVPKGTPGASVSPAEHEKRMKRIRGIRILVAEDNPLNRDVAGGIFHHMGIHAQLVENGRKAVEAVRDAGGALYDAVLLDLRMPVMDGLTAAEHIRAMQPDLPLIALSADIFEESVRAAKKSGMAYYVTKPLEERRLEMVLYDCLTGSEKRKRKKAGSEKNAQNVATATEEGPVV
jgi:PAS domain S-box-containing protein